MQWLREFVRLAVFAVALLIGVQIPAFVDQYAKRVDAHLIEARHNFEGFQRTADRHFGGNVEAMIAHHEKSPDPVFNEDADNIRTIWMRVKRWQTENAALSQGWVASVWHIAWFADRDIYRETKAAFTHTIPLTSESIIAAIVVALAASIIVDLLFVLMAGLLRIPIRSK